MMSKIVLVVCFCVLATIAAAETVHSDGVSRISDVVLSRSRRSCGAGECNEHCKKLGHARGVCIGTYCQCRSRRRRSLENVENVNDVVAAPVPPVLAVNEVVSGNDGVSHIDEVVLPRSRRYCGARECNEHCRNLGHVRGVCIGSLCQCRSQ